jgi:hypothetical protein
MSSGSFATSASCSISAGPSGLSFISSPFRRSRLSRSDDPHHLFIAVETIDVDDDE